MVRTTTRMLAAVDGPAAEASPSAITSKASTTTRNLYKNPERAFGAERSSQGSANSTASIATTPKIPPAIPGNTVPNPLNGVRYQGGVSTAGTSSGFAAAAFKGFSPKCGAK